MRTRKQDWTIEQIALLTAMYPDRPMVEIISATGKSVHAIYSKAQSIRLHRAHKTKFGQPDAPTGHKYPKGNVPWNAGKAVFKITSRDLVIGEFKRNPVQTTKSLAAATGVRRSGCWKTCSSLIKSGEVYISDWLCDKSTNWNKEAVYTFGPGESIPWAPRQKSDDSDPFEIQPIPRPILGAWGMCWPNITIPADAGERNWS